ncbi:MAG: acetate--CoA ligase family protein [Rhodospirillaceae bacterium]|nr:acetate--CoA ligase family protein [Rhodospirillaceae bacterium]
MRHRLDPLLRPRSIAVVGATPKIGSYGREVMRGCLDAGFPGRVFLVNPGYKEIEGHPCYPDLRSLPEAPEHAILAVANPRIEAAVDDAIGAGVKAATIFASCMIDEPRSPDLRERIRRRAADSGLMICGANGTGFYNRIDRARCQMSGGPAEEPGNVSLIVQSGSVLSALVSTDRLRFNFTVSTGQEITTSAADYLEFALSLEGTRAIGLYIETIRNPAGFVAQLERAATAGVAVVIVKLGRSEKSREFALSHTGAIAGNSQAYEAVFEHYGAQCVDDPDELVSALQLFSTGKRSAPGKGLVAILDSGGERELLADMADRQRVPFAEIGESTRARVASRLDFGLVAENPLDAWGTGHGFETLFEECLGDLLDDPEAGIGLWVADLRDGESYHERYAEAAMRLAAARQTPLAFATCYARCRNERLAVQLRNAGVPVLEGMRASMAAVRSMMNYSAFLARPRSNPPTPDPAMVEQWRTRLASGGELDEATALSLLADFGVPVAAHRIVEKPDELRGAADSVGYPVALKTAAAGIRHKSDVGGVKLALQTPEALHAAYDEMSARLGPRVVVAAMAARGVELSFGLLQDPDFGPIVMIGAGGTMIELLKDAAFAVPPVDAVEARRLIDRLTIRDLLRGWRGEPPADLDALSHAFARFSALVAALGNDLAEIDVNPVIAGPDGVTAVDALIIPRAAACRQNEQE